MKKFIAILSLMFLANCGMNGNQKMEVTGGSYNYLIVKLEFLEQIRKLCEDLFPEEDFENKVLRNKEVSKCVLDNMKLFNFDMKKVGDFYSKYCLPDSDLTQVPPDQLDDIQKACQLMGNQ